VLLLYGQVSRPQKAEECQDDGNARRLGFCRCRCLRLGLAHRYGGFVRIDLLAIIVCVESQVHDLVGLRHDRGRGDRFARARVDGEGEIIGRVVDPGHDRDGAAVVNDHNCFMVGRPVRRGKYRTGRWFRSIYLGQIGPRCGRRRGRWDKAWIVSVTGSPGTRGLLVRFRRRRYRGRGGGGGSGRRGGRRCRIGVRGRRRSGVCHLL